MHNLKLELGPGEGVSALLERSYTVGEGGRAQRGRRGGGRATAARAGRLACEGAAGSLG